MPAHIYAANPALYDLLAGRWRYDCQVFHQVAVVLVEMALPAALASG